ncbi:MAG: phosphatidylglycerophosphatase A [Verrucomicrobiales bacterium]
MSRNILFFEIEGLRLNVRALLQDLDAVSESKTGLLAVGPYDFMIREEAQRAGWATTSSRESARVLVWFAPDEYVEDADVARLLEKLPELQHVVLVFRRTGRMRAFPGLVLLRSQRFKPFYSLGNFLQFAARSLFVPRWLIRSVRSLGFRLRLNEAVGGRFFKKALPASQEIVLRHRDAPDRELPRLSGVDRVFDILLSFFYCGYFPLAPGTMASLAVAGIAYYLSITLEHILFGKLAITAILATLICFIGEKRAETKIYKTQDPRPVVLDEVAGMSLTLLFLPHSSGWEGFALAFIFFRLFDIFKPGIAWLEKMRWPGVLVFDDLLAGLYAGVLLLGVGTFWPDLLLP